MRIFDNPYVLSSEVVRLRVRKLDPLAETLVYSYEKSDGEQVHYTRIDCSLSEEQINALLRTEETPAENQAVADYQVAAEAADYIHGSILNGQSQGEVDAWIDANVTSLAGARAALKMLAGSMINARGILENLGKAVVFLRDLVVRADR